MPNIKVPDDAGEPGPGSPLDQVLFVVSTEVFDALEARLRRAPSTNPMLERTMKARRPWDAPNE